MLPIILPLNSDRADSHLIGNKAYSLSLLPGDIRTPGGIVLTSAALEEFIRIGIEQEADDLEWLLKGPLPEVYQAVIEEICRQYSGRVLAVRSSSNVEVDDTVSAAGIFHSEIGIPSKAPLLEGAIRRVWASILSDQALMYRVRVNVHHSTAMAVLIQPLVQSYVAGVAFTRHPITGKGVLIEATPGLGIPLVEGLVTPDRFLILAPGEIETHLTSKLLVYVATTKWLANRAGDRVLWRRWGQDHEVSFLRYIAGGVAAVRLVDEPLINGPSLSSEQIQELYDACLKMETHYHKPVDIEWAYDRSGLVILQVRPASVDPAPETGIDGTARGKAISGMALSTGCTTGEVVKTAGNQYAGKILCVDQLSPADVGKLVSIKGVIVSRGGLLSHVALLCRELGIPCVQLQHIEMESIRIGQTVQVDGATGRVILIEE